MEFKDYFLKMWNSIPDKWLTAIPKPESPDSTGSCFDNVDNDHDGKLDNKDEDCNPKIIKNLKIMNQSPPEDIQGD